MPTIWTVYDHPRDYPSTFVARKFEGGEPTGEVIVCPDVEPIRAELAAQGFARLERSEGDDPKIMESWL